jgi:hypothetical protein
MELIRELFFGRGVWPSTASCHRPLSTIPASWNSHPHTLTPSHPHWLTGSLARSKNPQCPYHSMNLTAPCLPALPGQSGYLSGSYVCLQSQYSDSRIEEVKPEGGCNRKSSISGQGLYHYGNFPHLDRALYSFHSSINESFHKLFLFRNFSVSQRLWIFGHYSNL